MAAVSTIGRADRTLALAVSPYTMAAVVLASLAGTLVWAGGSLPAWVIVMGAVAGWSASWSP